MQVPDMVIWIPIENFNNFLELGAKNFVFYNGYVEDLFMCGWITYGEELKINIWGEDDIFDIEKIKESFSHFTVLKTP